MNRLFPCFLLLVSVRCAFAAVTLNEVLYDPDGADGGREFVELHNGGRTAVCLDGWRLQFANGAVGDVWAGRWTGSVADTIAPGGFYLVVDQGWAGTIPDAVASLSLQNGPDALRLLDGEGLVDLLGYGDLAQPALYEGHPHDGAGGGASLARRPDGRDTDDNASDWTVLDLPTPGVTNYPPFGLEVVVFRADPPSLTHPGPDVRLDLAFVNAGVDTLPAVRLVLLDAESRELAASDHPALAPDAVGVVVFRWRPFHDGVLDLQLGWPLGAGEAVTIPAGGFMCGIPPLILTEVMAGPDTDACEWTEIAVVGEGPVDLAAYSLRDEGGASSRLPDRILQVDERLVLVQDAAVFEEWCLDRQRDGGPWPCPLVDPRYNTAELAGAWPTLNNTAPGDRDFADRVHLLDARGVVVDHVTVGWAGAEVRIGRSLERTGLRPAGHLLSLWGPSTAAVGSTPGCSNSLEAVSDGDGALAVLRTGSGGDVQFSFDLYVNEQSWHIEIYDLTGCRIRDLGGDSLGPGPRRVAWDGRDDAGRPPPAEALVAVLTIHGGDGACLRRHKRLLVTPTAEGS